jgi:DNA polymerase III subunit epsilon
MDAPEARELPQDLVFVDLETTGGNAAYHRITEIGIVRVERGVAVEEWSTLVNPECLIPAYIESFTGITNQMVAAAPRFADIAHLVLEKLGTACPGSPPLFAAHNARFDYSFLRAEFRRAGVSFSAKVLCTVKLSRRLFPEHVRHSLDAVMERHELSCTARHRALGDARVISDLWLKLTRELPEPRLAAATHSALGRHKLPEHLPADLPDELPEGPGIYRLYGACDELLYVGKSASLRTGVLAHFAEDRTGSREQKLRAQVRRVDWVETAGELGALLREIECLRTRHPTYNRPLGAAGSNGFTIRLDEAQGSVQILSVAEVDPARLAECFGLFHSAKDARKALIDIAAARALCLKLLGLEASDGSCFAYQLGKCRGACAGREAPRLHALRAQMALASLKLKAWPFPGRVALRERNPVSGDDLHVFDRWTYLGSARSEEELQALAAREVPGGFDAHVYRVLVRYLASHPKLDWHDLEPRRHAPTRALGFDPIDVS